MGVFRMIDDWCVDDDRLVIWSFKGAGESAYNGLVEYYGIKEVVINTGKDSVVPEDIFKDCKGIETVKIRDGVAGIGSHAFDGCSGLTSVTIPDSVTSIGNYAFFGCSNLKNISIPAQLQMDISIIVGPGCAITRRPKKEAEMAEKKNTKKREEVDLYESKFVYFDWKDCLVGTKGFYADNMGLIMSTIRENGVIQKGTLIKFGDDNAPFVVQPLEEEDSASWRFFYYDPHYEVKWAYFKEGKTVQFRQNPTYPWKDILPYPASGYDPDFFNGGLYEFRIKPEEPKPEVEVNVDVKVNNTSSDNKIKITINGKECVFENAEQARMVLKG